MFLHCLELLILLCPPKVYALFYMWFAAPDGKHGKQLWNKNSVQKNEDGSVIVLSKLIPNSTTDITQYFFYSMSINCLEKII